MVKHKNIWKDHFNNFEFSNGVHRSAKFHMEDVIFIFFCACDQDETRAGNNLSQFKRQCSHSNPTIFMLLGHMNLTGCFHCEDIVAELNLQHNCDEGKCPIKKTKTIQLKR
ncbi:hypothetical protein VP01_2716g3 [Puccinia sorghi]|uniref:Uncharacterized protein n=1 Tax=Puccinia sorghi TaxID=27349 RepID=A0A0L6V3H7_9BASI|nr:hypothetical protein VP01_2716g3 [Puccinia sorghi]